MNRIVIDARESGTSTGRYVDKLVENLNLLHPSFEVILLTKPQRVGYLKEIAPGFPVREADFEEFTLAEQLSFKKYLKSLSPDLVHFAKDNQPVFYRGKTVTTMHDLTTVRFTNPAKFWLAFKFKQLVYRRVIKRVARKSSVILVPSEFVKDDLAKYTGVNRDKIVVTHEAADQIDNKPINVPELRGKPFIMYVGRPLPHKNLERLLKAFKEVKKQQPELLLALAGKQDSNYRRIAKKARRWGVKDVVFTGYVGEGQLRWMYENCLAYVLPSLSEGFGLPGLEATMHGAPVVSSNATCLPEIYGDAVRYFDPTDVNAMAAAIGEVVGDKELRRQLVEKGLAQASKYTWRHTAKQTLAVYEKVLGK